MQKEIKKALDYAISLGQKRLDEIIDELNKTDELIDRDKEGNIANEVWERQSSLSAEKKELLESFSVGLYNIENW